jgi:hypothetical protein
MVWVIEVAVPGEAKESMRGSDSLDSIEFEGFTGMVVFGRSMCTMCSIPIGAAEQVDKDMLAARGLQGLSS